MKERPGEHFGVLGKTRVSRRRQRADGATSGGAGSFVRSLKRLGRNANSPARFLQTARANGTERVGFEPTVPEGTPVFETGPFDHSGTSPRLKRGF